MEALPYPALFRIQDSWSLVLHRYTRLRITYFQVYFDWLIGRRKLEGIGEVVCECLPDAIRVGNHRYQVIGWQFLLKEPLSSEFLLVCDGFSHNFDQIAPSQREFELLCFNARGIDQISYQSHFRITLSFSPLLQALQFRQLMSSIV